MELYSYEIYGQGFYIDGNVHNDDFYVSNSSFDYINIYINKLYQQLKYKIYKYKEYKSIYKTLKKYHSKMRSIHSSRYS